MMLCAQNKNADHATGFFRSGEICLLPQPPVILNFETEIAGKSDSSRAGYPHPGVAHCLFRTPLFPLGAPSGLSKPRMDRACIILISEALLALRVYWVTIYFTPLAWTGYLLLADSLVASLQGT